MQRLFGFGFTIFVLFYCVRLNADPLAPSKSFDLTGSVVNAEDQPISGASVGIYTARMRKGTSTYCPSCFADCAKRTACDSVGHFSITALSSELIFRVLTLKEGYEPSFSENIDPAAGLLEIKLKRIDPWRLKPGHFVKGRVLDPQNQPIAGATIEPFGMRIPNGMLFGRLDGVDPLGVSNQAGEFVLTCQPEHAVLMIRIGARGLATKIFNDVTADETLHDFSLVSGAAVTGKVQADSSSPAGASAAHIQIGLVQVDRSSQSFVGPVEIGTDAHGKFIFNNVAPGFDYYLYGIMNSLPSGVSIPIQQVKVKNDGEVVSAPPLQIGVAHRLAGRVVLADGKAIPPETRLLVSRENAWDSQLAVLKPDGSFSTDNVPQEKISLSVRVPGYHLSAKNQGFDTLNQMLAFQVDQDVSNFEIVLEPDDKPHQVQTETNPYRAGKELLAGLDNASGEKSE